MVQNDSLAPKLVSRWLLLLTTVAMAVSCGGLKKAKLDTIGYGQTSYSVRVGTQVAVIPSLKYEGPRGPLPLPRPEYSSSDPTVATINADGIATGVKIGSTVISAKLNNKTATTTLTVTSDRMVVGFQLDAVPRLIVGSTVILVARATYNDGTNAVVTDATDFKSSDATVANVSTGANVARGVLVALKPGTTQITATWTTLTASTTITVTGETVRSLAVDPAMTTVAKGAVKAFKAIATLSDSSTLDVTNMATWTSSAPALATVSTMEGSRGVATGVAAGTANIIATFSGMTAMGRLTVTNFPPTGLVVTPPNPTVPVGASEQMTATVTFANMSTQEVTTVATWTSSNTAVASVDANGKVTAKAVGTATIAASFGGPAPAIVVMGSTTVTVTDAKVKTVSISAASGTVPQGLTQQYMATAVYTDGTSKNVTSTATWATLNANVARISNAAGAQGLLTAVAMGMTTVSATFDGVVGTVAVTVTSAVIREIAVSPANQRVAVRGRVVYFARGLYSDGSNRDVTNEVAWSSSMPANASISNVDGSRGFATGLAAGTTAIRATLGGVFQETTLTVTTATLTAISINPAVKTLAKGTSANFIATGTYSDTSTADVTDIADWTSSVPATATVTSGTGTRGRVTGVTMGTSTITASFDGKSVGAVVTVTNATLSSISLSPINRRVPRDFVVRYHAAGVFSDNTFQDLTDQVTWASSVPAVATISNSAPTSGRTVTLTAGTTSISATMSGVTAATDLIVSDATLSSVAIAPASSTIPKTITVDLVATGTYSDTSSYNINELAFWSSSAPAVATVSIAPGSEGRVTGVTAGSAVITASFFLRSGTSNVTVTDATLTSIDVVPATATVGITTEQQFVANGTFSDMSTHVVTGLAAWSTSDRGLAEVYNNAGDKGRAVGLAAGTATITAAIGAVTDSATLTINPSPLKTISVSPPAPTITVNGTQQFSATGQLEDGTPVVLTNLVTWTSTNVGAAAPPVATISNNVADHGLATGLLAGTATVTATYAGIVGMATMTVNNATLVSVALTPKTATIGVGGTQQYTLRATYSDGEVKTVTAMGTYRLQNGMAADGVVSISGAGVATGVANGTSTITATFDGKTDTATITVNTATLQTIRLVHGSPEVAGALVIAPGLATPYRALGTYSDMTERDVTAMATWSSSNTAVVTLAGVGTGTVTATSVIEGMSTVTGAIGGIMGTSLVTVLDAALESLTVDPATDTLPKGSSRRFTATGVFVQANGNRTSFNLSEAASWMTSDAMKATVDLTAGNKGIVTAGNTTGAVTITASATVNGITKNNTATLTVTNEVLLSLSIATVSTQPAPRGIVVTYTASGNYTNGARAVDVNTLTWSAVDANIAELQAPGQYLAKNVGTTTVRAVAPAMPANIEATATFTVRTAVVNAITISGPTFLNTSHKMAKTTKAQLTATARYTDFPDTPDQNVTTQAVWGVQTPAMPPVVTFAANDGIVEAANAGSTTVTATFGDPMVTGTYAITVSNATITSLAVGRTNATLAPGASETWTATGTFFDPDPMAAPAVTTQPLDLQATWISLRPTSASVSNIDGQRGLVTALTGSGGMVFNVSAFFNGVGGSNTLEVSNATLVSVSVSPAGPTLLVGQSQALTATGLFSDNTTSDLTNSANLEWTSVTPAVGTITNMAGVSKGVAAGVTAGTTEIRARWVPAGMAIIGTTTLTVSNAPITNITVTAIDAMGVAIAPPLTKPVGVGQQFRALAIHPVGAPTDVTTSVTWGSSNPDAVSVSAAGVVTGVQAGQMSDISATFGGATSNTYTFIVDARTLQTITLTATPGDTVAKGVQVTYVATGRYSDGSAEIITSTTNWAANNGVVITTGVGAGNGVATTTAATVGTGTVTVTDPGTGVFATANLTITPAVLTGVDVQVNPTDPMPLSTTITAPATKKLRAVATFSDGTTDNTYGTQLTWTSSNGAVATVSTAAPKGIVTPTPAGSGGVAGMTTITGIDPSTGLSDTIVITVM